MVLNSLNSTRLKRMCLEAEDLWRCQCKQSLIVPMHASCTGHADYS
eukprot:CAMPEP_0195098312 /NCGR_PEP_ID=MMETSP0448-20130528/57184_1 /TAXON_ID=66468 /ORGANISM="Heterocapsa triquestra, Strain CCMP 448" /LENGTH=45 /DNA_ID= /DNA_START= /DNA_END= /DNA_ORIENTATION=